METGLLALLKYTAQSRGPYRIGEYCCWGVDHESVALSDKQWHHRWNELVECDLMVTSIEATHANLLELPYVGGMANAILRYFK